MATIVNNPAPQQDSGGMGFLIGVVILVVLLGALVFYGLPAFRNMGPIQVNVPAAEVNVPAPQVNVDVSVVPTK